MYFFLRIFWLLYTFMYSAAVNPLQQQFQRILKLKIIVVSEVMEVPDIA